MYINFKFYPHYTQKIYLNKKNKLLFYKKQ